MKLEEIQRLPYLVAINAAVQVEAAEIARTLAERDTLLTWGREVYRLLLFYEHFTDLAELREDAPEEVRGGEA